MVLENSGDAPCYLLLAVSAYFTSNYAPDFVFQIPPFYLKDTGIPVAYKTLELPAGETLEPAESIYYRYDSSLYYALDNSATPTTFNEALNIYHLNDLTLDENGNYTYVDPDPIKQIDLSATVVSLEFTAPTGSGVHLEDNIIEFTDTYAGDCTSETFTITSNAGDTTVSLNLDIGDATESNAFSLVLDSDCKKHT